MSVTKTPEEVEKIRISATLLTRCLNMLEKEAIPETSGAHLDQLAETFIRDHGAIPAFKNYAPAKGLTPFPATICFSRNHVLVHGVPRKDELIEVGDILSIDCGLSINGWFADAAKLLGIGELADEDKQIIEANKKVLEDGIAACQVGKKLGDVCSAIQIAVARSPFFNVIQFCGHAIGQEMHEAPQVPNFGKPRAGITLKAGMVFCLEPMLLKNNVGLGVLSDGWTVVTLDKSRAAHIEKMVLITEDGPEILAE